MNNGALQRRPVVRVGGLFREMYARGRLLVSLDDGCKWSEQAEGSAVGGESPSDPHQRTMATQKSANNKYKSLRDRKSDYVDRNKYALKSSSNSKNKLAHISNNFITLENY